MAFCDFAVRYDPDKDTPEDLTKKILYSIWIKPIKGKKPRVVFVGGDSGEGKSYTVLRLQEILLEMQGLKLIDYLKDINVITPLEYTQKFDNLIHDKNLKKINIIAMHEAREVVKAKLWHGFLAQAISDVNAMSRSIKRFLTFIVSQFIRDITTDIRYTLNYYCIVRRPLSKRARLYINVMWKDDRDLEKPKLRKRKLSGYLIDKQNRYRRFVPQYLEVARPSKEVRELFDTIDTEAKRFIIRQKLDRLAREIKADIGEKSNKVSNMVTWYIKHTENIPLIGKQRRGNWRVSRQFKEMHELNEGEVKLFEKSLNDKLKEAGKIGEGIRQDRE